MDYTLRKLSPVVNSNLPVGALISPVRKISVSSFYSQSSSVNFVEDMKKSLEGAACSCWHLLSGVNSNKRIQKIIHCLGTNH